MDGKILCFYISNNAFLFGKPNLGGSVEGEALHRLVVCVLLKSALGQHVVPTPTVYVTQLENTRGREQSLSLLPAEDRVHIFQRFARAIRTTVRIQQPPQVTVALVNWDMVKRQCCEICTWKKDAASKIHTKSLYTCIERCLYYSVCKVRFECIAVGLCLRQVLPLNFLFHKRRFMYQLVFQSRLSMKVICGFCIINITENRIIG